jgi:hypothetical protein
MHKRPHIPEPASFAPGGLKEFRIYKDRMRELVSLGLLTPGEAHILDAIKMQGIQLDGGADKPIREPVCQTCGKGAAIIGKMAETFRCPCSPEIEQSVADGVRLAKQQPPG